MNWVAYLQLPKGSNAMGIGLLIAPSENFLIFLLLQNYLSRKLVFILCLIWRLLVFIIWFRDTQCYFFFIENYLSQKLVFTEYLIHKYTTNCLTCKSYLICQIYQIIYFTWKCCIDLSFINIHSLFYLNC